MKRYLGIAFAGENLLSAGLALFLAAVVWMLLHLGPWATNL